MVYFFCSFFIKLFYDKEKNSICLNVFLSFNEENLPKLFRRQTGSSVYLFFFFRQCTKITVSIMKRIKHMGTTVPMISLLFVIKRFLCSQGGPKYMTRVNGYKNGNLELRVSKSTLLPTQSKTLSHCSLLTSPGHD